MKSLLIALASVFLLISTVQAKHYQCVQFNYNIENDGKMMSNADCQRIFSDT